MSTGYILNTGRPHEHLQDYQFWSQMGLINRSIVTGVNDIHNDDFHIFQRGRDILQW